MTSRTREPQAAGRFRYRSVHVTELRWLLMAALIAPVGCFGEPELTGGRLNRYVIEVNGRARSYRVFAPAISTTPLPVVLLFHGGGGDPDGMAALTGMDRIAAREGFLAVYPQGVNENWNDGRPGINSDVDDVAFVAALLDDLALRYTLDPRRVYATGISNGGHFSNRLAFDLSDRVAAIAPVAASLSVTLADGPPPPRPMPVLLISGTDDPLAPYNGGKIGLPPLLNRGEQRAVPDAVRYWVQLNAANALAITTTDPDRAPFDGTRVRRERYEATTADSAPVELLAVDGGGHTWPGGRQYLPASLIGRTSRDIDASEEIWRFFRPITRPNP